MKPLLLTWVEISKSAFQQNVSHLKTAIGPRNLAVVVKANAYGHGLLEIAALAEQEPNVDWLCVAFASEALTLRKVDSTKPILIMSAIDIDPQKLIGTNIRCMVDTIYMAQELNKVGKKHHYTFPIHIKIDTGLSRFGIPAQHAVRFITQLQQLPNIIIEGIYSHFAESNNTDRTFTNQQINLFQNTLTNLQKSGIKIPHIHFSNSAAAISLDLSFCTLFRVGIAAYGLWPNLKPVLTWKSRIISIKDIPEHASVGYNRSYQTIRTTRAAIIPIGYYDGYDIRFSNNGVIYYRGKPAPIIGRVAMNATMIDVTDLEQVQVGDEIIVIGEYPGIRAVDLSARIDSMNVRELTTKINPLISRIVCP